MDFEPVGAAPVRSFKLGTAELDNARHAALCRRNQTKCACPNTCLRYCQEESKFFNDFSRAHARARKRVSIRSLLFFLGWIPALIFALVVAVATIYLGPLLAAVALIVRKFPTDSAVERRAGNAGGDSEEYGVSNCDDARGLQLGSIRSRESGPDNSGVTISARTVS